MIVDNVKGIQINTINKLYMYTTLYCIECTFCNLSKYIYIHIYMKQNNQYGIQRFMSDELDKYYFLYLEILS